MAKNFSAKETKKIIHNHQELIARADLLSSLNKQNIKKIKKSAEDVITSEIVKVLKGVPIDYLSKAKKGIRVKTLKDNGFDNLADIFVTRHSKLEAINGISDDGAYTIKGVVQEYANHIRKETKIKLSADKRDLYTSALIKNISIYKNTTSLITQYQNNVSFKVSKINSLINDLKPATSPIKWLFTSKAKKELADKAYIELNKLYDGEYGDSLKKLDYEIDTNTAIREDSAWEDFSYNTVQFYNILEQTNPGLLGNDDSLYGLPEDLAREIQKEEFFTDGLTCTLRRYQELGVKYILHQKKALLGDEMGLGKTIQAIAVMVSLKNIGSTHFVVVCPASVLSNWCREIIKHSTLRVTRIHGSSKEQALESWIKDGGVAVTTYETTTHFDLDDSFRFSLLVVDEAHFIKNSDAKRTINTINLSRKTDRLIFMTGTALENNVDEMINLIKVLNLDVANIIQGLSFMAASEQFRLKVAPVYYRRRRKDVLTELPEKVESKEWCILNSEEEQIYEEAVIERRYSDARRVSWNVDDLNNSSKALRMKEIIEEAGLEGRKVLVFSFFLDTIRKIHDFLGPRCLNPINGSVNTNRRQEIVDEFNNSPAGTVLLAQIQTGGTGLNIQSASVVIICEPQFKPSIENQAISRAYRMGQSRDVFVYRLLCDDTVDEQLTDVLEQKQKIFDSFADKSAVAEVNIEIDDKVFSNIIDEEIKRINIKRGVNDSSNDNIKEG